jgi:hypothetical protein
MGTILPIDKMTTEEKIQAMETLWDDLCKQAGNIPSPSWHGEVLQVREDGIEKGEDAFSDWDDAKKRIRDSIS